jgi:hypothetical protein
MRKFVKVKVVAPFMTMFTGILNKTNQLRLILGGFQGSNLQIVSVRTICSNSQ